MRFTSLTPSDILTLLPVHHHHPHPHPHHHHHHHHHHHLFGVGPLGVADPDTGRVEDVVDDLAEDQVERRSVRHVLGRREHLRDVIDYTSVESDVIYYTSVESDVIDYTSV